MPHSYYIVHLEEKTKEEPGKINPDKEIYAQLRCFAYPGAFASSIRDEFNLKEYELHPVKIKQFTNNFNPNERKIETSYLSLSEIISVGNREDYEYIMRRCKEILMERNPNIEANKIQ